MKIIKGVDAVLICVMLVPWTMHFMMNRPYVAHDSEETEGSSLVRLFLHRSWQKAEGHENKSMNHVQIG